MERKIYVAVGGDFSQSLSALLMALRLFPDNQAACFVLLHVNLPIRYLPSLMGNIPVDQINNDMLDAHLIAEQKKLNFWLKRFLEICSQAKVKTETLVVDKAEVSRGIVETISELDIRTIFVGTTSPCCCRISRKMKKKMNRSRIGDYVHRHAIDSCQVLVVHDEKIVLSREGSLEENSQYAQKQTGWNKLRCIVKPSSAQVENHRFLPEIHAAIQQDQDTPRLEPATSTSKYAAIQQDQDMPRLEPATSASNNLEFREYSFAEIKACTCNFSDHSKLGEGGYGKVYKGKVQETTIAAKILGESSSQGLREFQHEIDILKSIQHPNLVKVVGACFERGCILYEYMSNGSLADRLSCKNNSPPLPWQARIRIATEVCTALHFLHSVKPDSIVHRDLKPQNILLDENYLSKISDFGLARVLPPNRNLRVESEMKGTLFYMDPEYLRSGEFSTKSDVYSMGMVILQLLTGKQALGQINEVKSALDCGKLKDVLDPCAGEWPPVQASKLAYFALRCTEPERKNRPDLEPTVLKKLEKLRDFAVLDGQPQNLVQTAQEIQDSSFFAFRGFKDSPNFNIL